MLLFLLPIAGNAQVPYGERVPDIRYHVSGQRKLSRLSNDDVLYTILYFGYDNTPVNGQSGLDANPEYFALTFSDLLKPYYNNFNPDYGRTLMVVSKMKGQAGIERKLGVTSYPDIVLVDPNGRIIARSSKAADIIDYIIKSLSYFAVTDWNSYILRAAELYETGQIESAQRIVSDCLRHGRWSADLSPEAHKAIPMIVASMKQDDMYMDFVGEIKHRYNQGVLSEEDVAPFKNEFSRIHMMGDKKD
jgi:hypothetical protein